MKAKKSTPKKRKIKNLGVPSGAPKYYFIREYSSKRKEFVYYNQKGEETPVEKVKSGKRKVFEKTKFGIKQPAKNQPRKSKKLSAEIKRDIVLKSEIFAYSVIGEIQKNVIDGNKNYFRMNGKDYSLSNGDAPTFCIMFSDIHGQFLDIFKEILPSPVFLVGYMQFSKNSFFDFDLLDLRGGGEFSELDFSDMTEIDGGEYLLDAGEEIKKAMKKFRALIKKKMKEYFNL